MHILVTNDDGVFAPGLLALVQALRPLGKITVLAPDRNWSASGHVKTLHRPLRVKEVRLADDSPALASDGAPSDCVALALLGLVKESVDLVVSGINPYANLGYDLTYSGTVTAAMEAVIGGLPALAVSVDGSEEAQVTDYGPAARTACHVAELVMAHKLPPNVLLNVNVPALPEDKFQGWRITRQGARIYRDQLLTRADPRGRPYYWIGGEAPTGVRTEGTDVGALAAGCVSITPVTLDLTAYNLISKMEQWINNL
ncbi:MAG TPA: 5'/3'-nucleotidase SurE [Anaerolineaceae bacterium]